MAKRKSVKYSDSFEKPMRNRGEEFNEPKSNLKYDYRPENVFSDEAQERAPRRHEIRAEYAAVYQNEQRRNERAFARVRDMENEFYAGLDPRRKQEMADGGMVREDLKAMANLPRQAIHCEYPQSYYYATPYLDDSIRGTDDEIDDDNSSMARFLNPYGNKTAY
jgi:hypothetical protein